MSAVKTLTVLCLLGCALAVTTTTLTFPDYTFNARTTTVVASGLPLSVAPGTGMGLTLKAIGDLDGGLGEGEYITIVVEGTPMGIWLDQVTANDPFTSYITATYCISGTCVATPTSTNDAGIDDGVILGYYQVPEALANAWLADGSLSITASWGNGIHYLVQEEGFTSKGDYFSITASFNAGSVVGDPHVNPLYADSFELVGTGMYTFFADDQLTVNARSSEPYRGFFLTEVAMIFDDHEGSNWILHGVVDDVFEPHLYFNDVEILPGTYLLGGNLRFVTIEDYVLKPNVQYFPGAANPGLLNSLCHIDIAGSALILLRVGVDDLSGGYFEVIVNPYSSQTRGVRGGMLMMTEAARDAEGIQKFAIDNIFAVPQLN